MDKVPPPSTTTHPETLWLVQSVPVALIMVGLLIVLFVLRTHGRLVILAIASRRAERTRTALPADLVPDPALIWTPPTVPADRFLGITAMTALIVLGIGGRWISPFIALLLSVPTTLLVAWGVIRVGEHRYVARLDGALTAAVGRLSALLRGGNSLRQALTTLLADMPEGPLKGEWRYLLERQGVPLQRRDSIATPQEVIGALAVQTPSRRHGVLLSHLTVAAGQPQDVLVARVAAAYEALQASERRRQEALTELAQMRYSGLAVGGAGVIMELYLAGTQWDRVVVAYTSPFGIVAAPVVIGALILPIVGGLLLSRADDVEY